MWPIEAESAHTIQKNTWWTDDSCILTMCTVMDTNSIVMTIIKVGFISAAVHIIQENRSSSLTNDAINTV